MRRGERAGGVKDGWKGQKREMGCGNGWEKREGGGQNGRENGKWGNKWEKDENDRKVRGRQGRKEGLKENGGGGKTQSIY